jgi:hypothetical protein
MSVGLCGACYQRNWIARKKYLLAHPEEAAAAAQAKVERRARRRAEIAEAARAWRAANLEKARATDTARNKKPERKANMRKNRRVRQYGMTQEMYDEMLEAQGWGCAICGRQETSTWSTVLAVDHCHKTGTIRGLLCADCNRALGMLEDSPGRLRAAIAYLELYAKKPST